METQGYSYSIHTNKMETCKSDIHTKIRERTHRVFVRHSHKENWDSSTQKKRQKGAATEQVKDTSIWYTRY